MNGRITGTGVLTFADGERYEGELKDGRMQVCAYVPAVELCLPVMLQMRWGVAGSGHLHVCER